jgi:ribosomal-protein-alanine N-acetyltransferase
MIIRKLYAGDLPQIMQIEEKTQVTPWSDDVFNQCMIAGYPGWVIEEEKRILGFIIVSRNLDECHILTLCVDIPFQRKGLGREILQFALSEMKTSGVKIAYLEVRRTNSRAIRLYEKMNFKKIGERKDYYTTVNGYEDALVFALDLSS